MPYADYGRGTGANQVAVGSKGNHSEHALAREVVVTPDLCSYLQTVSEIPHEQFDEDYSIRLVEECAGYEEVLCVRSDTSRSLEAIFQSHSSTALPLLKKLLALKKKKFLSLLTHRNGSRVIESMLKAILMSNKSEEIESLLQELVPILAEEWTDICNDVYGSHVLRSLGMSLAGVDQDTLKNAYCSRNAVKIEPFKMIHLKTFFSRALAWNLLKDCIYYESSSMLTQDFISLDVITRSNNIQNMLDACFEDKNGPEQIREQMRSKQGSRVWDTLLQLCSEDQLETIYHLAISGQLPQLALHNFANFPVQRLVRRCKTDEMATNVFDELMPVLRDILAENKHGVITSMLSAACVLDSASKSLVKSLLTFLDCRRPKSRQNAFALCLISIKPYQVICPQDDPMQFNANFLSYHGSLFAQSMLNGMHKGCSKLVKSILSLSPECLSLVACHSNASHVIDAFFCSEKIEPKHKENLFEIIGVCWGDIACDKYGSRVLDTVWANLSMKYKCALAQHLSQNVQTLLRNQFGRIIAKKYLIETYSKKNETKWRNCVTTALNKYNKFKNGQGLKRNAQSLAKGAPKKKAKVEKIFKQEEESFDQWERPNKHGNKLIKQEDCW